MQRRELRLKLQSLRVLQLIVLCLQIFFWTSFFQRVSISFGRWWILSRSWSWCLFGTFNCLEMPRCSSASLWQSHRLMSFRPATSIISTFRTCPSLNPSMKILKLSGFPICTFFTTPAQLCFRFSQFLYLQSLWVSWDLASGTGIHFTGTEKLSLTFFGTVLSRPLQERTLSWWCASWLTQRRWVIFCLIILAHLCDPRGNNQFLIHYTFWNNSYSLPPSYLPLLEEKFRPTLRARICTAYRIYLQWSWIEARKVRALATGVFLCAQSVNFALCCLQWLFDFVGHDDGIFCGRISNNDWSGQTLLGRCSGKQIGDL